MHHLAQRSGQAGLTNEHQELALEKRVAATVKQQRAQPLRATDATSAEGLASSVQRQYRSEPSLHRSIDDLFDLFGTGRTRCEVHNSSGRAGHADTLVKQDVTFRPTR